MSTLSRVRTTVPVVEQTLVANLAAILIVGRSGRLVVVDPAAPIEKVNATLQQLGVAA